MYRFSPVLCACLLFNPGCGKVDDPWVKIPGGQTKILVSFPPLYCFAKQIAGDHAKVLCLATTTGPHHFEPTPDDVHKASTAHLILYNGLGLDDDKINRMVASSRTQAPVIAVGKEAIPPKDLIQTGKIWHIDHWHPAGPDPHVWLGPNEAMAMVRTISAAIQKADPANQAEYLRRTDAYLAKLKEIHALGEKSFQGKSAKIVTMHKALDYFARNFSSNITIEDTIQIQPGVEGDATKMGVLVKRCKEANIRIAVTEPQYPATPAEALQRNLALESFTLHLVQFDTLETAKDADLAAGYDLARTSGKLEHDYYLTKMRQNLERLAEKLP